MYFYGYGQDILEGRVATTTIDITVSWQKMLCMITNSKIINYTTDLQFWQIPYSVMIYRHAVNSACAMSLHHSAIQQR